MKFDKQLLVSLVLTAGVSACGGGGGGGGGSSSPPPVVNAAVGGIWEGTTTISGQGSLDLIGLVAEDGRAHFIQEDGVQYWGTVTSSGTSIAANFSGAVPLGETFADGVTSGSGSLTGTVQARSSLSANATFTTTAGTRTTSTIQMTYNPLYDRDSSLSTISGNYTFAGAPGSDALNIAPDGRLFLQIPGSGCVANGQVTVLNAAYNAYDLRYTYSNCTGAEAVLNGATFRGIGTLDNTGTPEVAIGGSQGTVGGTLYSLVFAYQRT